MENPITKPNTADPKLKTIEFARIEDIEGIISVQNSRFVDKDNLDESFSDSGMLLYKTTPEELKGIIGDGENHMLLVSKDDDFVTGYALSYSLDEWIENKPEWNSNLSIEASFDNILLNKTLYLRQIAVMPGKEGAGAKLELKLFNIAKERGYKFVVGDILEKPIRNKVSMDFHERIGFIKAGTIVDGDLVWAFLAKKLD
jgi:hypothetical protein